LAKSALASTPTAHIISDWLEEIRDLIWLGGRGISVSLPFLRLGGLGYKRFRWSERLRAIFHVEFEDWKAHVE
jgi:hypothetical protein